MEHQDSTALDRLQESKIPLTFRANSSNKAPARLEQLVHLAMTLQAQQTRFASISQRVTANLDTSAPTYMFCLTDAESTTGRTELMAIAP